MVYPTCPHVVMSTLNLSGCLKSQGAAVLLPILQVSPTLLHLVNHFTTLHLELLDQLQSLVAELCACMYMCVCVYECMCMSQCMHRCPFIGVLGCFVAIVAGAI